MMKLFTMTFAAVFGFGAIGWAQQETKTESEPAPQKELTPEAKQVADELKANLPEGSEARAMLDAILKGGGPSRDEGWFRVSVSQTRFDWESLEKTYDADGDHRVSSEEFGGTPEDFSRLNRDEDKELTEADFDWSADSLTRTPGYLMFFQADRDANGKLTPDEFQMLFRSLDSDSRGYLSLDDLRDKFQPPSEQRPPSEPARPNDRPTPSTLVLALNKQEIGSLKPGPELNETAPDFTLTSLGGEKVTLSEELGAKPIVLVFGNFTCGPFRSQSGNLEKLYARYRDRAKFYLIYVREAHPSDGWWMNSNERAGIKLAQPKTNSERRDVAMTCQEHLKLSIPFLVDSIDDSVGGTYSGMPNRLYLIDQEGKIAFKNSRGPFGFHPRQLEQALVLLLNQTEAQTGSR